MPRLFRLFMQLLCALLALLAWESRAHAAAPMCGEDAISVEAPPPIYPSDDGYLSGCGSSEEAVSGALPVEREGSSVLKQSLQLTFLLPSSVIVAKATAQQAPRLEAQAVNAHEHAESQFRPPRRA